MKDWNLSPNQLETSNPMYASRESPILQERPRRTPGMPIGVLLRTMLLYEESVMSSARKVHQTEIRGAEIADPDCLG